MLEIFRITNRLKMDSSKRLHTSLVIIGSILLINQSFAQNPFVRTMYTADPSAHVWSDGRLYVYPSHDISPPRGCDLMDRYHVFSTDDMVNWTDHGEILCADSVPWGRPEGGFMWAPDCAFQNDSFYFYFPHPSETEWNTSWKIGIASSKYPDRDFKVKGYIPELESMIDPCVFIDDDNQVYFYYGGGGVCKGGKLKSNMREIDGSMAPMTGLQDFHEATWVHKRNGIYYLSYSDNNSSRGNRMRYAVSNNPLGPWTYKGIYIDPTGSATNHGSIVEYKGQWYAFYHNSALSGGHDWIRSICFDSLFYNEDGTIQKVKQTKGHGTPYGGTPWTIPGTIEAENYDIGGMAWAYSDSEIRNNGQQYRTTEGVDIEKSSIGGYNVGWISPKEWLEYTVDVTSAGLYDVGIVVGSLEGSKLNIKLDGVSITGSLIVPATGGWQTYDTVVKEDVNLTAGQYHLQVYMEEGNFNFEKMIFTSLISGVEDLKTDLDGISIYPNPVKNGELFVQFKENLTGSQVSVRIVDLTGKVCFEKEVSDEPLVSIPVDEFEPGIYLVTIKTENTIETQKIIIE